MYLKSLVLKGFKSFADRSVLTLEPGITAIVGPNGSGKSNISDAVLWVLGERNAKHLRGQAMEDVIFAGSSARKATGLAEVDLVLDNTDGTLPVDFSEVAITRRMYRNGESEYLINGSVARRMDVLDILHDSGLGTGTHSIISQGSLDSILQSRPEDRRALIEEAAGVLKHKQRKAKSERKLEQMDIHLARARDVVAEVERQLAPLERKAKRARAYQGLADELSEATLQLAVDDLRILQRKWDEVCTRESTLSGELEKCRTQITQAEEHMNKLQEKIRLESVDANELSRKHRQAASALEHLDSAMLVARERRRSAQDRASELEVSLEANKAKRSSAERELASTDSQLAEVKAASAAADEKVAMLEKDLAALTSERSELEHKTTELGRQSRKIESSLDAARLAQAKTQEALTQHMAHIKLIEGHQKELNLQFEQAKCDADTLSGQATSASNALDALVEKESQARAQVAQLLKDCENAREVRDTAQDKARALASEIKSIEEIEHASARAAGPALAWLQESADTLAGKLSPLAHTLVAPVGKEALVEHLLGKDIAALLINDAASAARVAVSLDEAQMKGVVTLVMREDDSSMEAPARKAFLAGVLGKDSAPLIDELTFPDEARRAVYALLGDIVVCESLDAALDAHAKDTYGLRFATEDGSVVWPSGKITLGDDAAEDTEGALCRARRLADTRESYEKARVEVDETLAVVEESEKALRAAQATSLALSQELATSRGKLEAVRAEATRAQEKLASVRREIENADAERTQAQGAVDKARPDAESHAAQVEELTQSLAQTKEELGAAQEAVAPLREQMQVLSDALGAARLSAATLAQRQTYTERVRQARLDEIERIDTTSANATKTLMRKRACILRMTPLLALFEELSANARTRTRKLEDAAQAAQDASSGLHDVVNTARAEARAAQSAFDEVNEKLNAARVDKGRLEVQVQAGVSVIVQDCATPLETALALPEITNRPEIEERAFKLRRRITNMGTINPDAAAEYEALKVRYDYLAGQLSDLDSARRSLAKINRVIDARMKDDFVRTYEAVDKNFQEIFSVLFPGGSAHLSLVDPDDLEGTGVEVSAQPRGKRITKMMLMSGGEKSLTALALLFAVYRIRSTPFYILDEVEAALDDTNLRRLVAYIETLRDHTQLIMITHQRRTMEMADVLFGVSMQADGVTKVISQKLERALEYAE